MGNLINPTDETRRILFFFFVEKIEIRFSQSREI